ncbi:MAG: divalent metal cation transporter [Opitutaceae bacterium]
MNKKNVDDILADAQARGGAYKSLTYARLSGPGWVQAAVTLGGGSLVGALYLGVIGGYQFMWLQPLAMLCGIIMLSAISYVTLSSEERPFVSVKKNISPTLAWGWLIATIVANVVFCSAQFALGTDAAQSNLGILSGIEKPYAITAVFAIGSLGLLWLSRQGGAASKIIDNVLKALVAVVVLAFMGVVIVLASKGAVEWGALVKGLIPDFGALFKPTSTYSEAIAATAESSDFWTKYIADNQRNVIIGAFGSAVGINMTFLLPYSLKAKGWGKQHRELSRYDLFLGLFVPFILATSFLVIATSSQFHARADGVHSESAYLKVIDTRLAATNDGYAALPDDQKNTLREELPQADKDMGVMLAKRNSKDLASSLEPFLGKKSQLIFGIGVLAMAISTMIVHMMMNGYAISEAFGKPGAKGLFMLGAAMPALTGFLSPILWSGATKTALVVPAAVIATTLLPIAYVIFILLMNSKKTLGEELPKKRGLINVLMFIAAGVASFASVWSLIGKANAGGLTGLQGIVGLIALPLLLLIGIIGFVKRNRA